MRQSNRMPVIATGGGNWELAGLCEIGLSEPAPVWRTEAGKEQLRSGARPPFGWCVLMAFDRVSFASHFDVSGQLCFARRVCRMGKCEKSCTFRTVSELRQESHDIWDCPSRWTRRLRGGGRVVLVGLSEHLI